MDAARFPEVVATRLLHGCGEWVLGESRREVTEIQSTGPKESWYCCTMYLLRTF